MAEIEDTTDRLHEDHEHLKKILKLTDPYEVHRRFRVLETEINYLKQEISDLRDRLAEKRNRITEV